MKTLNVYDITTVNVRYNLELLGELIGIIEKNYIANKRDNIGILTDLKWDKMILGNQNNSKG